MARVWRPCFHFYWTLPVDSPKLLFPQAIHCAAANSTDWGPPPTLDRSDDVTFQLKWLIIPSIKIPEGFAVAADSLFRAGLWACKKEAHSNYALCGRVDRVCLFFFRDHLSAHENDLEQPSRLLGPSLWRLRAVQFPWSGRPRLEVDHPSEPGVFESRPLSGITNQTANQPNQASNEQ